MERKTRAAEFDLFISYKSEDVIAVRAIVAFLMAAGVKVWFDEDQVLSGNTPIDEMLRDAITRTRYAVIFHTKAYASASTCMNERQYIMGCLGDDRILTIDLHKYIKQRKRSDEASMYSEMLPMDRMNEILGLIAEKIGKKIASVTGIDDHEENVMVEWYQGAPYHHDATGWTPSADMSTLTRRVCGADITMKLTMEGVDDDSMLEQIHHRRLHHREFQEDLRKRIAAKQEMIEGKCISIHIIPIGGFFQYGYSSEAATGRYKRVYKIYLADRKGKGLHLFTFVFDISGDFKTYISASMVIDRLVSTFRWPAEDAFHAKDLILRAYGRVEIAMRLKSKYPDRAMENFKVAADMLQEAIKLEPGYGDSYNELSIVYGHMDDFGKAVEYAHKAAEVEPKNEKFWSNWFALRFEQIKRMEDSDDAKLQAMQLIQDIDDHPGKHPTTHVTAAKTLAFLGQTAEMWMMELERMVAMYERMDESSAGVYFRAGEKEMRIRGMLSRARAECERLSTRSPGTSMRPWAGVKDEEETILGDLNRRGYPGDGRAIGAFPKFVKWAVFVALGVLMLRLAPVTWLRINLNLRDLKIACVVVSVCIYMICLISTIKDQYLSRDQKASIFFFIKLPIFIIACELFRELSLRMM